VLREGPLRAVVHVDRDVLDQVPRTVHLVMVERVVLEVVDRRRELDDRVPGPARLVERRVGGLPHHPVPVSAGEVDPRTLVQVPRDRGLREVLARERALRSPLAGALAHFAGALCA
jgi:hypothetical protein